MLGNGDNREMTEVVNNAARVADKLSPLPLSAGVDDAINKSMNGNRIAEVRNDRGIEQQALAKIVGMSSAALRRRERYGTRPSEREYERIAQSLGCSVADVKPEVASEEESAPTVSDGSGWEESEEDEEEDESE